MNKKFFLSMIFIFLFFAGYSQYHFGIKAGLNINKQKFSPNLNSNSNGQNAHDVFGYINTFHFGVTGDYFINNSFGITSELLYEVKGTHYNKTELSPGFDHKLTYISLPILLDYSIFKSLTLQAGVETGYLLKTEDTYKQTEGILDDIDQFNRLEFSGIVGFKYNLPANVYLSIRYIHGITSLLPDLINRDANEEHNIDLLNRTYQLSIGYVLK